MQDKIFSRSTTIISLVFALLAGAGVIITPQNSSIILVGVTLALATVMFGEQFTKINKNAEDIKELSKKLDIEKRLFILEKEIAEQKGKLSMVIKNER